MAETRLLERLTASDLVMVATAGEGANWGGNGAPGTDVILVDHVLTGAPLSCHLATPNP
jgi:hypothetical protein